MLRWFRSQFAWRDVHDQGNWLYQENTVTGKRRAIKVGGCFSPLNHDWLDRRVVTFGDILPTCGPLPAIRNE